MTRIHIAVSRPYDVCIGAGILPQLGAELQQLHKACTVAVIADDTVMPLYGEAVCQSLRESGFTPLTYTIPSGESAKNLTTYTQVLTFLAENRLSRSDLLLALGGGVVGDLVGFAAATFLRGVDYVQVPTTLLSAVDSSVGGKTAVDLSVGKNLVGAFHQPILVWCDPDTLSTLPAVTFRDGCAEVIKYALLDDAEFFTYLRENAQQLDLTHVIARCVDRKRSLVVLDEFDNGLRQLLNLGHTFGHAVEKLSDFALSHGKAVAIGTAMAARIAVHTGHCDQGTATRIMWLLEKFGLPIFTHHTAAELSGAALSDKKRAGDTVNLILPKRIGECTISPIPVSELEPIIQAGL